MEIHSFVDEGLGHSSYLIDLADGRGALIDPPRFPEDHERTAHALGMRLAWTIDTHSHADYVTGSPSLAARIGARFVAPDASRLATPHLPVVDGARVELALGVVLVALATPGHTPDHHAYVLEHDGVAVGVFTGGSLMVGTVGRTDLCGPDLAVPLAHAMYRSLNRLANLPDEVAVYPTHGAGSFCGAAGGDRRTSTLGRERATNPLLQCSSEAEFVTSLVAGFGTFPSYFARLPELNRLGPSRYDAVPHLPALDVETVRAHMNEGAVVVDARPIRAFATGHIPGALSDTLRPVFGSWLGWLVPPDTPLMFVLDDDQDRADLVRQCLDVGHEHLLGELAGSMPAWTARDQSVARVDVTDTIRDSDTLHDVRQHNEYATAHVPGARNVELAELAGLAANDRTTSDPTTDIAAPPTTVMCGHGERAMTAASLLARHGQHVAVFDGGPDTWAASTGRELERG